MQPIKEHFLIGDLHTAALVTRGDIVWMCLPHFDSPSVFASILDENAGTFALLTDGHDVHTRYEGKDPIVRTTVKSENEEYILEDFMVPQPTEQKANHLLVRKIVAETACTVRLRYWPRQGYGQKTDVRKKKDALLFPLEKSTVYLHLPEGSRAEEDEDGWTVEVTLDEGETARLVLEDRRGKPSKLEGLEGKTRSFWDSWVAKGEYNGPLRNELVRSAVTLKLLQFYPTGGLIAAPTTSLPEVVGGERNWDYRYVWIRDATFTLYAFYVLGHTEELIKFFQFIEHIMLHSDSHKHDLSLIYTIKGAQVPKEEILDLAGYRDSKPVRTGNGAAEQFQLDIYGSLIDAYYFLSRRDLEITEGGRGLIKELVSIIEHRWKEPDNGIWEVRAERQHYTYSKVMAWVGVDRAVRLCGTLGIDDKKREEWQSLADEIKEWIWDNCYDEDLGSFVQYPGTKAQDATNLLFVLLQFLDKHDDRTEEIIQNTCKELANGPHVYRYRNEDCLHGNEGSFVLCTFWRIAAMAAVGQADDARQMLDEFRDCLEYSKLMPEEFDPNNDEYLGNYPQAFSHMGLVLAAHYLRKYGP